MSTDGTDNGFADVLNGLTLGRGRKKRKRAPDPAEPLAPGPGTSGLGAAVASESGATGSGASGSVWPGQGVGDRANWSWTIPSSAPVVVPAQVPPVTEDDLVVDAAMVRPYAWTGGRTKSTVDLRIETMVSTSEHGENIEALTQTEHRAIASLCDEPRSVAEVATLLSVPLGVAKVLLGDMSGLGLVIVHRTAAIGGTNKAHLTLMERVLSGLRRL